MRELTPEEQDRLKTLAGADQDLAEIAHAQQVIAKNRRAAKTALVIFGSPLAGITAGILFSSWSWLAGVWAGGWLAGLVVTVVAELREPTC
jgi:hypothetical protein